ncbi:ribosome biogenesis protein tsr1 [Kappamyces sp. JEL0680]|nr:ribosome biogenesis protein tsr1 [Kappamyces sp. JEL0680]
MQKSFVGALGVPKQVAVVSLCPDTSAERVIEALFRSEGEGQDVQLVDYSGGTAVLHVERFKQKFAFIPTQRDLVSVLDGTRVADMVLFVLSAEESVDDFGETLMTAIKSQGVPNVVCVVEHLNNVPPKKQMDVKKSLLYYMNHHFVGDHKLFSMAEAGDCLNCIRHLSSQFPHGIQWRDRSPYLVAQHWDFQGTDGHETGTLRVTGYARGSRFSANRLVHIPEYGDFQIHRILSAPVARAGSEQTAEAEVLETANPDLQESLEDQNVPDPMDAEQTWPTEQELQDAQDLVNQRAAAKTKRVPKGTSSYQAAWILEDDEDGVEAVDSDDDQDMAAPEFESDDDETDEEYEEIEMDNRSVKFDVLDDDENAEQYEPATYS